MYNVSIQKGLNTKRTKYDFKKKSLTLAYHIFRVLYHSWTIAYHTFRTLSVVFCRLLLFPGIDSSTSNIKFSSGSLRSDG
ncbi:hypothetical protein BpHYR1_025631 [Brachionus plicatilis]|uniref:Uncharacterized protein n=1 Tax=Brachionus plicatilis TaxID=10195 RepID=A0A3M7SUI7_BRAPC|nr:hypothetical protein BpHYR1_025631 [Brachionus plicatilis]